MASVTYTAKRSLLPGVVANDEVTFDFFVDGLDRRTQPKTTSSRSLSGKQESHRDRTDIVWSVSFSPQLEADFGQIRQFLDSVDGGEAFIFDPYGTAAAPISPLSCVLDKPESGYNERRVLVDYLTTSTKVRQV